MVDDDDRDGLRLKSQIYTLLLIFGSAALIIAAYQLLKLTLRRRRRQPAPVSVGQGRGGPTSTVPPGSSENSMAQLIPAHKFRKGGALAGPDAGDGTCPVCLCDFEEGEELRSLGECKHSFHVDCIDMWLYSHSTCPVCRGDAVPSPALPHGSRLLDVA
ncbi:RING-H2 finger protein ATL39-like [Diospyros lotus]|uniref:RING-H2 finger protein ATL39-like n=1 Tax=Diospyros lotus TaxID=55363 RepID=UPI0022541E0F|nr:RING-H2 finger protein ATL39-like [Diospyros lotus]